MRINASYLLSAPIWTPNIEWIPRACISSFTVCTDFWFIKFTTHENKKSYIFEAHAGLFVIFATLYLLVFIRITCWKLEGFGNSSSICPFQYLFLKERLDFPTDEIFERVISKNQK